MEERSIFKNISPIDHRYYLSNKDLSEKLSLYLSEEAVVTYCIKAELALLKCHIKNIFPSDNSLLKEISGIADKIPISEVYEEEEKNQHNIRALVNVLVKYVPEKIKNLIHLGATSVDILDTAFAMRIRDAARKAILPLMIEVEELLINIAKDESSTLQVGRTHGQHAVPITFGFAMSEYVSRLGKSIIEIERLSNDLRGKLAGATGSYNATSVIAKNPEALEEEYLSYLGLKASEHSTQLVEPEYMLRLLLEMNTAFGVLANLADDLRNLQRSEINEVRESFSKDQVGSSTMPQKRNPWNSEHVKSLWKTFSPRVITFFMDQISEHQRDLTNSASQRFVSDYIAGFAFALNRMKKILTGLIVNKDIMLKNLGSTGDLVLAEAAYIILAVSGEPDSHEFIRKATLECEKESKKLVDVLKNDKIKWDKLNKKLQEVLQISAEEFFSNPLLYTGKSKKKALKIADKYILELKRIKEAIN